MEFSLQTIRPCPTQPDSNAQSLTGIPVIEVSSEEEWLAAQLSKPIFQLYRIWLVISCLIVAVIGFHAGELLLAQLKSIFTLFFQEQDAYDPVNVSISCIFLSFGCYDMFSAIKREKSEMAHKGMLKFQYSLGFSLVNSVNFMIFVKFVFNQFSWIALLVTFVLPAISAISFIGGLALVKVFQMDHPLVKLIANQKLDENGMPISDDRIEQNRLIESELSRFDEKFEKIFYLAFKWFLKLAMVLEIIQIPGGIIMKIVRAARNTQFKQLLGLFLPSFANAFGAYCSYDMDIVLITRKKDRSERALIKQAICIVVSIIASIVTPLLVTSKKNPVYQDNLLLNLRNIVLIPLVTFVGGLITDKILKGRESPVAVSSFPEHTHS